MPANDFGFMQNDWEVPETNVGNWNPSRTPYGSLSYGNYCGPGWTGGTWQGDFTKTAIDKFDAACREHDRAYTSNSAWDRFVADKLLVEAISGLKSTPAWDKLTPTEKAYFNALPTAFSGKMIKDMPKAYVDKLLVEIVKFKQGLVNVSIGAQQLSNECFPFSTSIALPEGSTRAIGDIRPGDIVLAFDPEADGGRGTLKPARVERLYSNVTTEWIELNWADPATGEPRTLTATPGHVMLTPQGRWKRLIEMVEAPAGVALFGSSPSGLSRGSSFVGLMNPLDAREKPGHDDHAPLAKGEEYGTEIGTVRLVDERGAVVTTGTNLKATDRLLRAAGMKCVGESYVG